MSRSRMRVTWEPRGPYFSVRVIERPRHEKYPIAWETACDRLYYSVVGYISNILWFAVGKEAAPPYFELPGLRINLTWVGEDTLRFHAHRSGPFGRTVVKDLITRHRSRGAAAAGEDMRGKIQRLTAIALLEIPEMATDSRENLFKEVMGLWASQSENSN